LVIDGVAGTVIVAVPDLVASAIEVAVTVTVFAELVGAGVVKVVDVVVEPDRVPALVVHLTPVLPLSFTTIAVNGAVF
jgi:hypothetical protein